MRPLYRKASLVRMLHVILAFRYRTQRRRAGTRDPAPEELHVVRRRLENFPEAMRAVLQAAHALRRPVTEVSADEVESWATARRSA